MPIIDSSSSEVASLHGVHLYHSAFSNCSQRVRLVLEEKDISWVSHEINLMELEHLSDAYQAIHPKGVVPALVHDGHVIVESNDIIRYLDAHFQGPALFPIDRHDQERVMPWLEMNAALQPAIKTLTYERILGKRHPPTRERLAYYEAHQQNQELVAFWRRFFEGFDAEDLAACVAECDVFLAKLELLLADRFYLDGERVTLADFSTVVNVHRITVLGTDLRQYPAVALWYERMRERPSFTRAILAYTPD